MQVPEDIRKCVAFLYYKSAKGNMEPAGTAFFLTYDTPEGEGTASYAVTARHVINTINKKGSDGQAYFRLNAKPSGLAELATAVSDWIFHNDLTVDAAVIPIQLSIVKYDHLHVGGSQHMLTDAEIEKWAIGPGDDLCFPGLFVPHTGSESNVPIVRVGNIAAMPGEPIALDDGRARLYLVEARSIGGLSGSPVFVQLANFRQTPKEKGVWVNKGGQIHYLLGLLKGHFDDIGKFHEKINMGIAYVVPASDIREILEKPAFVAQRVKLEERIRADAAAIVDAAEDQQSSGHPT